MAPTVLSGGVGSERREPMATIMTGGLVTSTLLTLVVAPVVCSLVDSADEALLALRPTAVPWRRHGESGGE